MDLYITSLNSDATEGRGWAVPTGFYSKLSAAVHVARTRDNVYYQKQTVSKINMNEVTSHIFYDKLFTYISGRSLGDEYGYTDERDDFRRHPDYTRLLELHRKRTDEPFIDHLAKKELSAYTALTDGEGYHPTVYALIHIEERSVGTSAGQDTQIVYGVFDFAEDAEKAIPDFKDLYPDHNEILIVPFNVNTYYGRSSLSSLEPVYSSENVDVEAEEEAEYASLLTQFS